MNKPDPVHGLTKENILAAFPISLQMDESVKALAEITARLLAGRPEEIDRLRLYPDVDRLNEKLLDILAYDFKVDWWDADYTLEEKQRTFKDSWRVHKLLGTRAAVETAIRAVYPKTEVQEWFEYGGKPYHFKLNIDLTDIQCDETRPWRVLERVNYYKSLRSHLDDIVFTMNTAPASLHVGGGVGTASWMGVPKEEDTFDFQSTLSVGGAAGADVSISIPEEPDTLDFRAVLYTGGNCGIQSAVAVPEDTAVPPAVTILRNGGVCTIISNRSRGE